MRCRRLWLGVCVLTATTACAAAPPYVGPQVSMPDAWPLELTESASATSAPLERWWTAFGDPLLNGLAGRAVEGNKDLQIASARILEARAARGIAAAASLPQVNASATYGRVQRSEAVPPFESASGADSPFGERRQNLFDAGFDASWELDVFGGVRKDKEAALAQVQAAEEGRRDVLVTLLADVARSYVELRGAQRRLALLDETTRSLEATRQLVRARFDAGLGTDLDLARIDGQIAATISQHPVLTRLVGEAIHRLSVLIGQEPHALAAQLSAAGDIPLAPPDIPDQLPSDLLSRRPDLRRAEREVAVATARLGVARADLFPRFAIRGTFGRRSDEIADLGSFRSDFWSLVPAIRWPLLSGGRIRANIRVHDARQQQAVHAYERTVLVALREVADALLANAREHERQESLRRAAAANRRARDVSLTRYTSGLESFLAVLDAERAVYAAEDALAQSEQNRALTLIAVYKSLGGGWSLEQVSGETP